MGTALSKTTSLATEATDYIFPASPKQFDVLLLGLDGAGKTSLFTRIVDPTSPTDKLPETTPTTAFNKEGIQWRNNHITLWDIGGQAKIRPLWRSFLWNGHAFIFVVDSTAPERFPEAKDELRFLHDELLQREHGPLLVLANKMDSDPGNEDALSELSHALDIPGLELSGRTIGLKGISATTSSGVELEILQWFLENLTQGQIERHNLHKKEVEQNKG
ncbi:ADP-ribosylation factor family-domain-containing protein [Mycena filopes]|nr:ADP-ribosylation factor family-domain-containing protein [Mycena filopes]